MKSECFETIERSLLEAVVKRDSLNIEEVELFKAVDLWATKRCEKRGLAADGKAKRRILGEEIIKGIRFPIMDEKDFASVVLDSQMLTKEEIVSVLKLRNSVPTPPKEFSKTKRSGSEDDIQQCCRFNSLSGRRFQCGPLTDHSIAFSVDRDIKLLGVCLFGSENNTYYVEVSLRMHGSPSLLAHKTGQFSSELLQGEKFNHFGFEVLLDSVISVKRNTEYYVEAKITGPDSTCGDNGDRTVTCSGVTFTFKTVHYITNCTTIHKGQFPGFIFSL